VTTTIEPVRRAITVGTSQAEAFRVFTNDIGRWWPATHSIGTSPLKTAVVEPRAGGRWYEIGGDGSQCDWGKVLIFDPPSRLVLAWQIGGDWRFNPELVTEVEVRFTPCGPDATLVELEHRYLERMGAPAEGMRAAFESPEGWSGVLELFARSAAADHPHPSKGRT
jgi:uncharacterized protein YndB with AHSA1/START domain